MAWRDGARKSAEAKATVLGPHGPAFPRPEHVVDPETGEIVGPLAPVVPQAFVRAITWSAAAASSALAIAVGAGPAGTRDQAWWLVGGLALGGICAIAGLRLGSILDDAKTVGADAQVHTDRRSIELALFEAVYLPFYIVWFGRLLVDSGSGRRHLAVGVTAFSAVVAAMYWARAWALLRRQRELGRLLVYQPADPKARRPRAWTDRRPVALAPYDIVRLDR